MLGRLPSLETKEQELKERPVLNSNYISNGEWGEQRHFNLDTLIYWVKRTPECIGIIKRIATDIVTEVTFSSVANQATGRPSKSLHLSTEDKAIAFWRRNLGKQKLIAAVFDWLMTGDAYIWKGKIKDKQFKELATNHFKNFGFIGPETKEVIDDLKLELFLDEDWNGINAIEVVPSSMTTIDHNDRKIRKYLQRSKIQPGTSLKFTPEEIIHLKFMELDGKVYGFTPMESSFLAIKTINAIQDYNYNYFANGVKLDRAWLFMGSPNQTFLDKHEENLKKYKSTTYAHGDLVVAGADNIKVENLNQVGEEMEFRKTAINAVGRLAFSFNMPADIVSSILGGDVKGTALGSDIDDAGYNRNIVEAQKYWENLLNTQLWNEFNVTMQFFRTFKQDQIRQVQYQTQASTFAEFLFKHDYPVTDEYVHSLLQIDRKFLTSGKIKREVETEIPFAPGGANAPAKKPAKAEPFNPKGPKQTALKDAKTKQQKTQQNVSPPGGS